MRIKGEPFSATHIVLFTLYHIIAKQKAYKSDNVPESQNSPEKVFQMSKLLLKWQCQFIAMNGFRTE